MRLSKSRRCGDNRPRRSSRRSSKAAHGRDFAGDLHWSQCWHEQAAAAVRACRTRQEQARAAVRAFGDAYHPFDATSGRPVLAPEVRQRLTASLDTLQALATAAELGERSQEAVLRVRGWLVV